MIPEIGTEEEMRANWIIELMVKMIEYMQENDTTFVPLLVPHTIDDPNLLVPQLSTMLGIEKEELPNFFALHPYSD